MVRCVCCRPATKAEHAPGCLCKKCAPHLLSLNDVNATHREGCVCLACGPQERTGKHGAGCACPACLKHGGGCSCPTCSPVSRPGKRCRCQPWKSLPPSGAGVPTTLRLALCTHLDGTIRLSVGSGGIRVCLMAHVILVPFTFSAQLHPTTRLHTPPKSFTRKLVPGQQLFITMSYRDVP